MFRLEDVPAGRDSQQVALLEDPAAMRIGGARFPVNPGETSEVVIGSPATEGARGAIVGRITAGGVPLQGAIVFARPEGASRRDVVMGRTEADWQTELQVFLCFAAVMASHIVPPLLTAAVPSPIVRATAASGEREEVSPGL